MLKRRLRLVALVTMIALSIGIVVHGGDRKRAKRSFAPVASDAAAPLSDDVVTICPVYPCAGGPVVCEWYAIRCINGESEGPMLYTTACNIAPQYPCNNCYPAAMEPRPCATTYIGMDGFTGDLQGPITIPAKGSAKVPLTGNESASLEFTNVIHENTIAKALIPGSNGPPEEVYLQLISKTTKPRHPLDPRIPGAHRMGTLTSQTGLQIKPQDKVDVQIDAKQVRPLTGRSRAVIVNYQGDEYYVLLKRN